MVISCKTACLRCLFPQLPVTPDKISEDPQGVFGPVCGAIGSMMASEAILYLSRLVFPVDMLLTRLDFNSFSLRQTPLHRNKDCPCCYAKTN